MNRAPMHANYFAYESYDAARTGVKEESDNFLSLNGMWKFNWVRNADVYKRQHLAHREVERR